MMMTMVMIHNNMNMRYNSGIMCHKTKTHRMKVTILMMVMMAGMMNEMTKKMTMATKGILTSNKMDEWRSYSDQKVVEL